jgi:hypothetical protein
MYHRKSIHLPRPSVTPSQGPADDASRALTAGKALALIAYLSVARLAWRGGFPAHADVVG